MSEIQAFIDNPEPLIAILSALATTAAILAVSWPYLQPDALAGRLRRIEDERERIRQRERKKLNAENESEATLRLREPRKIYQTIVSKLGLGENTEDTGMRRRLQMAGYRGTAAATAYVAVGMISTVVLFLATFTYLYFIIRLDQPLPVTVMFAALAGALGYFTPPLYIKNRISKRQAEVAKSWPDALDLMLICIESGMAIESVFRKVAEEIGVQSPVLAEELSLTTAELSYLQDRRRAYENLAARTEVESVRSVVTSLIQSEKYGTPLARAIRVLAQESRDMRMAQAEKKAASLPPMLTVPMILFFMPVLFAVITTPAIIQIMES
ncbi:MAG TPA: type II secretion system F family protein [Thermohalobaculum sp.]|nr:type II secretion system F family protein [Thermohalobaculum sp.]